MRLSTLKELLNQIDEIRFESSNGTTLTDHIQITEVSESQKNFDRGAKVRMQSLKTTKLHNTKHIDNRLRSEKILKLLIPHKTNFR